MIEVDRDFDSFDRLLGLHTWSEFLQRPSKEQLDKTSKVFYCTYHTGRDVEKNGPSPGVAPPLLLTHVAQVGNVYISKSIGSMGGPTTIRKWSQRAFS